MSPELQIVVTFAFFLVLLTCVPLFMLMAEILRVSGLSSRIYSGLAKLVARLPGGLLQTNSAGCAIFASVSGSSIATAASSPTTETSSTALRIPSFDVNSR